MGCASEAVMRERDKGVHVPDVPFNMRFPGTTIDLMLLHGRTDKAASMNDWGEEGPRIQGIVATHTTYAGNPNLFFESIAARNEAVRLTGWERWDDLALVMPIEEGMVRCLCADGITRWYGDWEWQAVMGDGKPLPNSDLIAAAKGAINQMTAMLTDADVRDAMTLADFERAVASRTDLEQAIIFAGGGKA